MKVTKITSLIGITLILLGCTPLKGVKDYAAESAKFNSYSELTTYFRDTYDREQPFVFGDNQRLARENDKKRQAAYSDLLKIQHNVSVYMQTLATLAGDDTFDVSREVGALGNGIKAYPDLGIEKKQVEAISGIAKVITKWATSGYQQHKVRLLVEEANAPLQVVLASMLTLVHYYEQTYINEKKTVLGFYDIEASFVDPSKDKLLMAVASEQRRARAAEYQQQQLKFNHAEKAIRKMAEGHQMLVDNIDKLPRSELNSRVAQFAKDIEAASKNIRALRD